MHHESKAIFQQIAGIYGPGGVKSVIENHDAWVHCDSILDAITRGTLSAQIAEVRFRDRPAKLKAQIARQSQSLAALLTSIKTRPAQSA